MGLRNALQLEVADIRRKAELTQPKQKPSQGKKADAASTTKVKGVLDDLDMIIKKSREPWKPADWPLLAYDASLVPEGINMNGEIYGSFPGEPLSGLEQESLQDKVKVRVRWFLDDPASGCMTRHPLLWKADVTSDTVVETIIDSSLEVV